MRKAAFVGLLVSAFASTIDAQSVDVPVRNWTVPPYTQSAAASGITTMTDVTSPRVFVGVAPCRIADTRGLGFSGQAGPPALNTGPRVFQISGTVTGAPSQCGIPTGADAVSFQFTIVTPTAAGNLVAWPGGPAPSVSVLNWSAGETALGNGTIVPLSETGSLSVQINAAVGNATGHLVLDVNGYFSDRLQTENGQLLLVNNSGFSTARFENTNPTCAGTCGVVAEVLGNNFAEAVTGHAFSPSGPTRGVVGRAISPSDNTAGVQGETSPPTNTLGYGPAGVRGGSSTTGVLGYAPAYGIVGDLLQSNMVVARGILGLEAGGTDYAVYADGHAHVTGTFTAANKLFVQPHPIDATKEIRYVSLEGPSSEIYFRGSSQVRRGVTRIPVPEHFRMVARSGSYSTLVTPVGSMATVAVLSEGEEGIVVQASRDVKVHYVVYAERDAFRDHQPVAENEHFLPTFDGQGNWHLQNIPESYKRLLIRNGTLRPDGSTNVETAERAGWPLRPAAEAALPGRSPTDPTD